MKPIYTTIFTFSLALVVASIIVIAVFGLRFGVDFKGGSVLEITFSDNRPPSQDVTLGLEKTVGVSELSISPAGEKSAILRMGSIDEPTHQRILAVLRDKFGSFSEDRFDSIGPSIGQELKSKSITAIIVLLIAIVTYIAFVFRKMSKVLSSWGMGLAVLLALAHDVIIPIGVFAVLGKVMGIEIGGIFVAAVLTILGWSISDTVVIFDRVRENVLRYGTKEDFGLLVHKSIKQTLSRSINTTMTTLLTLFAIFFFGGESIKYFSLAMIIGIFLGAYSSIFVASPILVWQSLHRIK